MPRAAARPFPCDIHRVAESCGVKLLPPNRKRTARRARECFAKATLRAIGRQHGEDHIRLVLRIIVDSNGNAAALDRDTITAVSALLLSGLVEAGADLFKAFDTIDLDELRTWAQAVKGTATTGETMAAALLWRLAGPERFRRPAAAEEEAAEAERRRIARKGRQNARKRRLARYAGADDGKAA